MKISKRKKKHLENLIFGKICAREEYLNKINIKKYKPLMSKVFRLKKALSSYRSLVNQHNNYEFIGGQITSYKNGVRVEFKKNDRKGKVSIVSRYN